MAESQHDPEKRYKVGRVLMEYDLLDLHDRLPDLWRGDSDTAMSLRDLADHINVEVLRTAMEQAGMEPLEGEARNAYRLLTHDDVSAGVRTQQRNRLERMGVDLHLVEADFVTHQAVYTYLTEGLDVSKDASANADPVDTHEKRLQRLRGRTTAVMNNSLDSLRAADEISLGRFDVVVDLQVYCQECERQYDVAELLREDGCNCE